ncbi:hypothetical protein [Chryseobacterium gallinarum]|uniref:Uncharacterized protein n=1 Tax=Chryseobacterium gallinarum TaxID=1324352 RepID=A0ABX6KQ77_CHRGL|nr:hypothetical protein [Chryseobacterium gallinarum]QIY90781.1 hypothetical protein FOB44_08915 [Chryseobacterium gallinarum]
MLKTIQIICFFCIIPFYSQLKLVVKELDYEQNKSIMPQGLNTLGIEKEYKGHILELTVINESDNSITFPLDTLSYALPFTEDLNAYYQEQNLILAPDMVNSLAVYGFIYQKGKFFEGALGDEPSYDYPGIMDRNNFREKREKVINEWGLRNNIKDDVMRAYNWYLMKNLITIKPGKKIKYKIYFNPFFKMLNRYGEQEFYYQLNFKLPYKVNFKIICNENLYKLLTTRQRKEYKNLFIGVVESNTLDLSN